MLIKENIEALLREFSELYKELKGPDLEIIICGGSALILLDLINRPTQDIDIIGEPFNQFFEAAGILAELKGLPKTWINRGPHDLAYHLPDGFHKRCTQLQYTQNLIFHLTSRYDQIHFKLLASVRKGSYHVQDLKELKPTENELMNASKWCLEFDVSQEFREKLKDFLNQQNWANVYGKIFK